MADLVLTLVDVPTQTAIPLRAVDNGDGTYSLGGLLDALGQLKVASPADDSTTERTKTQPVSSMGSGGRLTADGTLHSGPCSLNGLVIHATTGGTIAISDAVGAAGTALFTVYVPANTSLIVPIPGLQFAVGVFMDLTTMVGSCSAIVGPAMA